MCIVICDIVLVIMYDIVVYDIVITYNMYIYICDIVKHVYCYL